MYSLITKTMISFPGFNIGEMEIDSIALSADKLWFLKSVFGESWKGVAWYGVIITIGIILSAFYGLKRAHQEGITTDDFLDVVLAAVISSVVGARVYYVIFFGNYRSLYDLIAIWEGGLAIYGAVIAGIISLYVIAKIKKISPLILLDIGASAIILGQSIGRWGNFMNGEAYGTVTDLPWRMCSPKIASEMLSKELVSLDEYSQMLEGVLGVHPTFLYESLWNIIGFVLIWFIYNRKKYNGQIFLTYLAWYGFGRMLIEGLRTDSLWLVPDVIKISQLVGAISFVVCTTVLAVIYIKNSKKKKVGKSNGDNN